MNILYAVLIALIVYPVIGTLLFILVEYLKTATKIKILIMTFGHPILTGIVMWTICSTFNSEIAEMGVLFVAGTLLRIPFSDRKYFSAFVKEAGGVKIEYFSELLIHKTISLTTSEITNFTQSTTRSLIEKPSELIVTTSKETLKFKILDKTTKVSLQ